MTDMKRITVAFPEEIDQAVYELRKDDRFVRCSYSEIIRKMVALGIEAEKAAKDTTNEAGSQDAS